MDDHCTGPDHRQRGLTLVELLLCITILAILTSLAPPAFTDLLARSRLGAVETDLTGLLASARSSALMRNQRVTLCHSADGQQCADTRRQGTHAWSGGLLFVDLDQNRTVSNDETVFYVANFSSAATILWNRGDSLVYQPDGTVLGGSNGTFTIQTPNSTREHRVIVSMMGRVRRVQTTSEHD
ncbi:MAG: prepilin-type N-terminal cleavage/methylation domain-containing protein [Oceanospirillales bacterium]|nr:prepilin-type N-terminal cleavage/methylation domain-containing protein [Oceanospirillales bacterium]